MDNSVNKSIELTNGDDFVMEMNKKIVARDTAKLVGRNFRPVDKGSVYLIATNITICGSAISFFWYPAFYRVFGVYVGFFAICFSALSNFLTSKYVTEASEYLQVDEYLILIEQMIPRFYSTAIFTFVVDYFTSSLVYILLPYNILLYLLYNMNWLGPETMLNEGIVEFHHYNKQVIWVRAIFCGVTFALLTPFFLIKSTRYLKVAFSLSMVSIVVLVAYMFYDLSEFRDFYQKENSLLVQNVTMPTKSWLKYSMIFLTAFYVQSNILTMKKDLHNPDSTRINAILKITFIILMVFATIFGYYCYSCMGFNHTGDIFILRKTFEGKDETVYLILLSIYGVLTCTISSYFNISLKSFLKDAGYRFSHYSTSMIPLILAIVCVFLYPKIVNTVGYTAVIVCSTNGYVFPCMLKHELNIRQQKPAWMNMLLNLQIGFYLLFALASFVVLLIEDFNGVDQ